MALRVPVQSASPSPVTLIFPARPLSSRLPVKTIGIVPWGVVAENSSRSALPTMVPLTGVSPSGVLSVPATLSPSCFKITDAGTWTPPIDKEMSHVPLASVRSTRADAIAVAGGFAPAVLSARLPVNGNSPKSPRCRKGLLGRPKNCETSSRTCSAIRPTRGNELRNPGHC